jgi:hypothetical protein
MSVQVPINTELRHLAPGYDPAKAHEYYERTKKLKGRQRGSDQPPAARSQRSAQAIARAQQKADFQNSIQNLQNRLDKLEKLIREKEAVLRRDKAQAKAKARKEKDKPETAAEKAKAARENKKYRDKHKQELKNKAKRDSGKSGGGSKDSKKLDDMSIAKLKSLATRTRGQIAVAKQKLAAL